MNTRFTNRFERDVERIVDVNVISDVEEAIKSVENARTLKDIPNLRKLRGYKEGIYYRIRIRRYRIGLTIVGGEASISCCDKKKFFYRDFPRIIR